ncbi:UvrD-helicase domain-containing protein [Nocardia salmonicida]|uniref:UvrD-helicase domain-containing protein n=1 Tax=Nocardia salmonicida TaxID=53431 RepID=UPI003CE91F54
MTSRITAPDTAADLELRALLDQENLGGFVMIAGAGSGKTTSLVKALDYVAAKHGPRLTARTQQAACITYTDVAAKEIATEIGLKPFVMVSTIHSFLWSLAKPFQTDVAHWVRNHIEEKIAELLAEQANFGPRVQPKTIERNEVNIAKLRNQLRLHGEVRHYTYGAGSDYSKGWLGHEDVLTMVPQLILGKKLMARVVARRFPYIFVDESQDTFPEVVRALRHMWAQSAGTVCLGFFGDPMQQIYQRGVGMIEPEDEWEVIAKPENFRSSEAVLRTINIVRAEADGLVQVSGKTADKRVAGESFFFVLPADDLRSERLKSVRSWLDDHSTAGDWSSDSLPDGEGAKVLMIVRRMAAKRMGFEALFAAFKDSKDTALQRGFDEGDAWPIEVFESLLLPMCAADADTTPDLVRTLRELGALDSVTDGRAIRERLTELRAMVKRIREAVEAGGPNSVEMVLRLAVEARVFTPDPRLSAFLYPQGEHGHIVLSEEVSRTLEAFMACDVAELPPYFQYVRKQSPYATHHGTKGAEFRKVIVVLDDEEGKKFSLYSYEKLLGIKGLSSRDTDQLAAGADMVLDRTRRLFYVCVSRAIESLAVVIFVDDVDAAVKALDVSGLVAAGKVITTLKV